MIKHVYDTTGIRLIGTEEALPECGQDFCDVCGDCLACYGEDDCKDRRQHIWIEHEGSDSARRRSFKRYGSVQRMDIRGYKEIK